MKIRQIFGLCGYGWYGYGGHQTPLSKPFRIEGTDLLNSGGKWISTVRAGSKFGLHRLFIDNWQVVPETQPPFTIKTNPTEQNFYLDDFFKLEHANGIKNIVSLSGCFDWYKPALSGQSQRKHACYNPAMSPSDRKAWADFANYCKLWAEYFKDKGLTDWLQLLNEWDFPFGINDPLTPEDYAVGAWEAIKAIRSVSPNQKIMLGCTLTPELETFIRLIGKLDELAESEGHPKERNVTLSFNLYNRDKSTNQTSGIGATFEETDTLGKFLKPFNDWCEHEGFDWMMTETGYNSSPSTSAAAMKNKAPLLQGFTVEESQGVLSIRTALICGSLSKCVGVTFYHCKDGYEAEPFTYHGFNYDKDFGGKEDWSAKPARTICEAFLDTYGDYEVTQYTKQGEIHSVKLTKGTDVKQLSWTDKKNISNVTPIPSIVTVIPPIEPPNPPTMARKIFITTGTVASYSPANELTEGENVPLGNYALYVDGEPPVTLSVIKEGGAVVIPARTEGGKPLAFGGDDAGKLRPLALTQGTHIVKVSGQPDLKFTVGATAPTPPVDIKGTEFFKTTQGKVKFKFADNTEVTLP